MKQLRESDITALTAKLEEIAPHVGKSDDPEWSHPPAVQIIDCVLSLNRPYDRFVVPRLKVFMGKHPEIRRAGKLAGLMEHYSTPHEFVVKELDYNHEDRARILHSVVGFVCAVVANSQTVPEEETLKHWASNAQPQDYQTLNIKGLGLSGFQYLRMLFGAETTKPDMHIRGFISEVLGQKVSDHTALGLLEAASERAGLSVRAVDKHIWRSRAREPNPNRQIVQKMTGTTALNGELRPEYDDTLLKNGIRGKYAERYAAGTNIVRLDPDVAAAFPSEEAVNEALRFLLKLMEDARKLGRHRD